jgi:beta-alanine degradation protein BauB
MLRSLVFGVLLATGLSVHAQDPVQTDGDKYTVLMENDQVRVLDYRDHPGEKTHQHHHPAFVLYALAPFKRSITLPDGKVIHREFKAGEVIFSPGQAHIGENTGDTDTHVIMVEMKSAPGGEARRQ